MNLLSLFVTYLTVPFEACILMGSCRRSKEYLTLPNQRLAVDRRLCIIIDHAVTLQIVHIIHGQHRKGYTNFENWHIVFIPMVAKAP